MKSSIKYDLYIVGAAGMGREVYDLCTSLPERGKSWEVRGFLDTRADLLEGLGDYPPILGSPLSHPVRSHDRYVCAVGDSMGRLFIAEHLRRKGARFLTLTHPTAAVGMNAMIGEGVIIYAYADYGPNVTLGDLVFLNRLSSVGHDSVVGEGATVGPQTCVGGGARIGKGVFIGTNATILPHAVIGDYAHVGPGSVVLRRVKPHTKVFGNPAVEFGEVEEEENWVRDKDRAEQTGENQDR